MKILNNLFIKWFYYISNNETRSSLIQDSAKNFFDFKESSNILEKAGDYSRATKYCNISYEYLNEFIIYCKIEKIQNINEKLKSFK